MSMKNIGAIFAALSDPTRRLVLENLKGEDLTPSEMLERIQVSQPTLSHHLDILKRAELGEKAGLVGATKYVELSLVGNI
jgi:DNA-binding transcriptional ArsR family regulator